MKNISDFIAQREPDLRRISGIELYPERREIIGRIYLETTSDINSAHEEFMRMYNQIKEEESQLGEKLDISISFDDSAVDELIIESLDSEREPGPLTFYVAKKLEYGLKLVKDRSGIEHFTITGEEVTDMDNYVNTLLKKYYRHHFDEENNLITDSEKNPKEM